MATDYDKGKVTDREKEAAKRQKEIANYNASTLNGVSTYKQNTAGNLANWEANQQKDIDRRNADQTSRIAEYNANATKSQLDQQLANYDFANRQNAALRDVQNRQTSRKSEAERFEAERQLQNAAIGLLGSMNQAMNGSTTGNVMKMFENRNDADNSTYWQQLQDNRNAIQNAYDESFNQNQIAKRDAAINAVKALKDIQGSLASDLNNINNDWLTNLVNIRSDWFSTLGNLKGDYYANVRNLRGDLAANLNNINPNVYKAPADLAVPTSGYEIPSWANAAIANEFYKAPGSNSTITNLQNQAQSQLNNVKQNNATLLDYIMPANAEQNVRGKRNTLRRNDYFSRLINDFN